MRTGRRKTVVSQTQGRHLATAAQTADSLHAVGPSVRAAAARWRQIQSLGVPRPVGKDVSVGGLPVYPYFILQATPAGSS